MSPTSYDRPRVPRMSDVAARAGVSHQTVSRVLNGMPGVRPETRDRGSLTAETAALTGLPEGIAVATGNVDAHVTAPAARAVEAGQRYVDLPRDERRRAARGPDVWNKKRTSVGGGAGAEDTEATAAPPAELVEEIQLAEAPGT